MFGQLERIFVDKSSVMSDKISIAKVKLGKGNEKRAVLIDELLTDRR